MQIKSFEHAGLQRLYDDDVAKGVPSGSAAKLRNMLGFLDSMGHPDELRTPVLKWKAHKLTQNRRGTWALIVTRNYRLTFWVDAQQRLCDLNLEDYH